jgi:heptosyltransferase-2
LNADTRILVVGPSWVGDMVMAQSLFMALKRVEPDCHIDVLAPAWSLALLARMPEVDDAIAMPLGHGQFDLRARFRLGRGLRKNRYSQALVLPNSWKSALIPFFADIPRRTGFIGEYRWGLVNDARKLDKTALTMTVQRFVALAKPNWQPALGDCPKPNLAIDAGMRTVTINKFNIKPFEKRLALCPGAEYGPAKRWPAAYFAELARQKIDEGWQVWLFGSTKDQAISRDINEKTGGACRDFTGKTALAEAIDLMSLVHAVVSNDSGLMHVAAALGKKVIALYGSSDPGFTPPLSPDAEVVALKVSCSPCFKRECPLAPPGDPLHNRCLTGIAPARIAALIDKS